MTAGRRTRVRSDRPHVPVLTEQVIQGLNPRPGGRYIDGTIGAGGHAAELLRATDPDGRLLGIDRDEEALRIAGAALKEFGERVTLLHANFAGLALAAQRTGFVPANGVLLDLGLSSMQLDDSSRGFSFIGESLDMRMDQRTEKEAAELVNELDESELADLIYRLGEEPRSRRIARVIVEKRPFASAKDLAEVIQNALGRHGRIHPATRTFQALRIAVNSELENLEQVLPQLDRIVGPGGRTAIITFHSLEDRIVKNFFKSNPQWKNLTKHPIKPTYSETLINPRARSAKLRVAEHT